MKNTPIILSICIPNYNRPALLGKNLEAIAQTYLETVEIVITDDCSPEKVDGVIKDFKQKYPRVKLHFYKNPHNLGFDKNVQKVISLAKGKYCWLLSNDDTVLPNSLVKITNILNKYPKLSLISLNYQCFDQIQQKITNSQMAKGVKTKFFTDSESFFFTPTPHGYFKHLGVNTLTMSTNIVHRKRFLETYDRIQSFIGINMIHVFAIVDMIRKHPAIYYVDTPQVQYLSNNHRVWPNDIWKDYEIHVLGYMHKLGFSSRKIKELQNKLKTGESRAQIFKRLLISDQRQLIDVLLQKTKQLIRL